MLIKKYENLLKELNIQIYSGNFDLEKNKEKVEKIISIYNLLKEKNYNESKKIIQELSNDFEKKITHFSQEMEISESCGDIMPPCPAPAGAHINRNWNIYFNVEDDNIENFNSIEMMTGIFLENLKKSDLLKKISN